MMKYALLMKIKTRGEEQIYSANEAKDEGQKNNKKKNNNN